MKKLNITLSCLFLLCIAISCNTEDSEIIEPTSSSNSTAKVIDLNQRSNCPSSHPYSACGRCWESAAQAQSGGCSDNGSDNSGDNGDGNNGGSDNGTVVPCGSFNYDASNTTCVSPVGNGNDGCINSDGLFVSIRGVVSNPCNTKEAILDIERNLGIDIDDDFVENHCGYQGVPPSINPKILLADAKIYFRALFGTQIGNEFGDLLNTNGDAWLDRNEATAAKGADPRQLLNLPVESGLATDDVLAYIGLYLGDGALDKYAGDLGPEVMSRMESFTRTWQPGRTAASRRYDPNN
ncbi:hypothetical protein [uncultured Tenacibaculum sp.]|uniref:hypothetical protein n=1 Tax=uncultured Tenacibaculum sp. TaxID=174713 RepID=UPI002633F09A|nr:hypothetical protein [uncultured Tenacibaculum sp.]